MKQTLPLTAGISMSVALAAAAALAALAALPAYGMDWYGMNSSGYFAIKGGAVSAGTLKPDTYVAPLDFDTKTGWNGTVALGGRVNRMIRLELEGSYAQSQVDQVKISTFNLADAGGELRSIAGMGNIYLDFLPDYRLQPYVGAGVGVANVKLSKYKASGITFINDDDSTLAWQAMAGLKYKLTPMLALTGEYKYFGTDRLELEDCAGVRSKLHYHSHNALAGLELSF